MEGHQAPNFQAILKLYHAKRATEAKKFKLHKLSQVKVREPVSPINKIKL